jgi:hypothetical protein
MSILDWATLVAGILGLAAITIGAGMVYLPAGFIVAGACLLAWSYTVARAAARGSSNEG